MRILGAVIVTVLAVAAAAPRRAEADVAKALAAAKDHLPASTTAIGAIDVRAIVKSSQFLKLFDLAMKAERDLREGYNLVKSACKLDPAAILEGLIIAGDPTTDRGVLLLQFAMDRKTLLTCLDAVAGAAGGGKAQIKDEGAITAITVSGETVYVSWVAPNVVALTLPPERKAELQAWIGQGGAFAKSAAAAQLAKVDTKAAAWGAFAFAAPRPGDDLKVVAAHGALTLSKGIASLALTGRFPDAKTAAQQHEKMQRELAREVGRAPEPVKKALKAFALTLKGAEITATGSLNEVEVMNALIELAK